MKNDAVSHNIYYIIFNWTQVCIKLSICCSTRLGLTSGVPLQKVKSRPEYTEVKRSTALEGEAPLILDIAAANVSGLLQVIDYMIQ